MAKDDYSDEFDLGSDIYEDDDDYCDNCGETIDDCLCDESDDDNDDDFEDEDTDDTDE